MEYIIKVNAQAIENKEKKSKFVVFNTYVKNPNTGEWTKFNVKFAKECKVVERTSYIYADDTAISINEVGKYPTIFISKVNSQKVIEFDRKDLDKFFKAVEESKQEEAPLGDPVPESDLPF